MGRAPNLLPMPSIDKLKVKVIMKKGECNGRHYFCSGFNYPSPGYSLWVDLIVRRVDQTA